MEPTGPDEVGLSFSGVLKAGNKRGSGETKGDGFGLHQLQTRRA